MAQRWQYCHGCTRAKNVRIISKIFWGNIFLVLQHNMLGWTCLLCFQYVACIIFLFHDWNIMVSVTYLYLARQFGAGFFMITIEYMLLAVTSLWFRKRIAKTLSEIQKAKCICFSSLLNNHFQCITMCCSHKHYGFLK